MRLVGARGDCFGQVLLMGYEFKILLRHVAFFFVDMDAGIDAECIEKYLNVDREREE